MRKRILAVFGIVALLAVLLLMPIGVSAKTAAYYSTSNDGTLVSSSANYGEAHDSHVLSGYDNTTSEITTTSGLAGQTNAGAIFAIYRGVLVFDTTTLPEFATVSTWTVKLYGTSVHATSDNIVLVQAGDVHNPLLSTDFDVLLPKITSIATPIDTAAWAVGAWNTFTGTSNDIINIGGYTVIGIRSEDDINGTTAIGDEYVEWASSESSHKPVLNVTYTDAMLEAPADLDISYPLIFRNYKQTGDQLYVMRTTAAYSTTPTKYDPSNYVLLQILDTDNTLLAQSPLVRWGYSPQAIYLDNVSALDWGTAYTLRIITTSMVTIAKSYDYLLTDEEWAGQDFTELNKWVKQTASWMSLSEGYGSDAKYYDAADQSLINQTGSAIFIAGIPYINIKLPNTFTIVGIDPGEPTTLTKSYSSGLFANWGPYWTGAFTDFGSDFHVSGEWIASLFFAIIGIIAMVKTKEKTNLPFLGTLVATSALAWGTLFGVPMILAMVACAMSGIYCLYVIWPRST